MLTVNQFIHARLAELRQTYRDNPPTSEASRAGYRVVQMLAETAIRHGECPQPGSCCQGRVPVRTRGGERVCVEAANLARMWLDHPDYYLVAAQDETVLPMLQVSVEVIWTGAMTVPVALDPSQFLNGIDSTEALDHLCEAADARARALLAELAELQGYRHMDDQEVQRFRIGSGEMRMVSLPNWQESAAAWASRQLEPWYAARERVTGPGDSEPSETATTTTTTVLPEETSAQTFLPGA